MSRKPKNQKYKKFKTLKTNGLEQVQDLINGMPFDTFVKFIQDKVKEAIKEAEEKPKPKPKKIIDEAIMRKLSALIKENRNLRSQNVSLRDCVVSAKHKITDLRNRNEDTDYEIKQLTARLNKLRIKKRRILKLVHENEIEKFVEQNRTIFKPNKKFDEELQTHEIHFEEDEDFTVLRKPNGDVILKEENLLSASKRRIERMRSRDDLETPDSEQMTIQGLQDHMLAPYNNNNQESEKEHKLKHAAKSATPYESSENSKNPAPAKKELFSSLKRYSVLTNIFRKSPNSTSEVGGAKSHQGINMNTTSLPMPEHNLRPPSRAEDAQGRGISEFNIQRFSTIKSHEKPSGVTDLDRSPMEKLKRSTTKPDQIRSKLKPIDINDFDFDESESSERRDGVGELQDTHPEGEEEEETYFEGANPLDLKKEVNKDMDLISSMLMGFAKSTIQKGSESEEVGAFGVRGTSGDRGNNWGHGKSNFN